MASVWSFIATFALPAPLLLIVLLNLPLPKPFRRGIYVFVSRVIDMPVFGVFKTLHFMMFVLAVSFFSAVRNLQQLHESHLRDNSSPFATPKYEIMYLSKRWRTERNLWLAGFAFSMWAVLATLYRELGHRIQLEDRLVDFEMSGYTMTADETTKETTREPSVSREVTSRKNDNVLSPRSLTTSPVKSSRPPRPPAATPTSVAAPKEVELVDKFVKKDL